MNFINYPDAAHAFPNASYTVVGEKYVIPIIYNPAAVKKSWVNFKKFMKTKVK